MGIHGNSIQNDKKHGRLIALELENQYINEYEYLHGHNPRGNLT